MSSGSTETMTRQTVKQKSSAAEQGQGNGGRKFLTFFLAGEEYGIEILKVHEIIGMMPVTRVPRTPEFIRGVMNLRGKVIPIMDLRLKFNMSAKEQTEETCIIVVQTQGVKMGVIVDKVSDVLDIAADDIEDAPSFGAEVDTDYILGIGKSQGQVKMLLDINKVLSTQEVADIHSAAAEGENKAADEIKPEVEVTGKQVNAQKPLKEGTM